MTVTARVGVTANGGAVLVVVAERNAGLLLEEESHAVATVVATANNAVAPTHVRRDMPLHPSARAESNAPIPTRGSTTRRRA